MLRAATEDNEPDGIDMAAWAPDDVAALQRLAVGLPSFEYWF
jgi:hypothetical protein